MQQVKPVPYASRLGVKAGNSAQLVASIRRGLPYRAFERLQREMGVSSRELADLVVIPARTLARRKVDGRLQSDESERLLRASRIYDGAVNLFEGDEVAALAWMRSPAPALGGREPIQFARTEVGAREVEDLIGRLEHGVFS